MKVRVIQVPYLGGADWQGANRRKETDMEFYSDERAAEFAETERAAVAAEKQADEQAKVQFETEPEHLS